MTKEYHFTYLTTNLENGKQYIGDHSTHNLNDGYLGSGLMIVNAVNKYGKESFNMCILEHFNTKVAAYNAQEKYIIKYNTLKPNGYNISPKGGLGVPGSFHNDETKRKIGKANKGRILTDKHKKKISDGVNRVKDQISMKLKGRTLSNKTKQKISDTQKDRIFSEEHRTNLSKAGIGRKISDNNKRILSEYHKGKPPGNKGKKHTEEQKMKMRKAWKMRKEKGYISPLKGKPLAKETCAKISEKLKKYYKNDRS